MQNPSGKGSSSTGTISDFEIITKLGKGSFGVVYKVKRKSNKTIYVLKQINISSMRNKMRSIALNEVKILSSLENPYVVKYYDSFIERDTLNIVMEHCEGGDLSQYIKSHIGKSIPEAKIWKFFIQMCIGMNYIHSKKILHRDIKALNIFLTKDGDIRIGDLGVAKVLADTANFAHTMVGTPYYLSPEMCEEKPYNEKSDIWALGCVLYELCTHKHPFEAHSQGTLILKIIKGRYTPISGTFSSELADVVNSCLNKDYKKRPTSSTLLGKSYMVEKAKQLGISLTVQERAPVVPKDSKAVKDVKEILVKNGALAVIKEENPDKAEKKIVKDEGKIQVYGRNEPQRGDAKINAGNKNENKIHVNDLKVVFPKPEIAKHDILKGVYGGKGSPRADKPEVVIPPKSNLAPKNRDRPLGPEVVAKLCNDGKNPMYIVVNGDKVGNKEPVKDERNVQRVRKGAPVELGRQAKNVSNQQKLVKKVGVEAPKIVRPVLLEEKEKAPIARPSLDPSKAQNKAPASLNNVEVTQEELDEIRNLPDNMNRPKSTAPQRDNGANKNNKDVKRKEINPRDVREDIQKPVTIEKPSKPTPSFKAPAVIPQEKITKEIVAEEASGLDHFALAKEKISNNAYQKPAKAVVKEEGESEDQEETKDTEDQRNYYQRKAVNGDGNSKAVKIVEGNGGAFSQNDLEEFKNEGKEDDDDDDEEGEQANQKPVEESSEDEDDAQEEEEAKIISSIEGGEQVFGGKEEFMKTIQCNKPMLVRKMERAVKKSQRTQELISEIRSNVYIKSLGDEIFVAVINLLRSKLESDEEINESDQDEIEQFLRGKIRPDVQVQVMYNIYRLLGLQIELQKYQDDVKRYQKILG